MFVDLSKFNLANKIVAVALSGGSDSVALLHYLIENQKTFNYVVKAINVEHGIRGKDSLDDSTFVRELCQSLNVPLAFYKVDAIKFSKEQKLSLEESARVLRYDCFFDALEKGFCSVIATAHHLKDNAETVLFNLFRGSGLKGLTGINQIENKIIRPLIEVSKDEIDEYIEKNALSFVLDKSNLNENYSRNYIRHQVLKDILKRFPDAEKSIYRFSVIAREENDFLEKEMLKYLKIKDDSIEIPLPCHNAILRRASIFALKKLGLKKDWEKVHVDDILSLVEKENGKAITLPKDIFAVKEYDKIVIYKKTSAVLTPFPFGICEFNFNGKRYAIEKVKDISSVNLKSGLYLDLDKISKTAKIRLKEDGDSFTKFGGGTKSLGDYLTDKKIPVKKRNSIPIIADGNKVLAVFGIEISIEVKVDKNTMNMVSLKIY